MKDGMNKKLAYGMLAAFYAPLLTDRQQALLEMYCDEDLSLSEIAAQLSISRQAVSDNLNRAYERLDELETHLRLHKDYIRMQKQAQRCRELLKMVTASPDTKRFLDEAVEALGEDGEQQGENYGI